MVGCKIIKEKRMVLSTDQLPILVHTIHINETFLNAYFLFLKILTIIFSEQVIFSHNRQTNVLKRFLRHKFRQFWFILLHYFRLDNNFFTVLMKYREIVRNFLYFLYSQLYLHFLVNISDLLEHHLKRPSNKIISA